MKREEFDKLKVGDWIDAGGGRDGWIVKLPQAGYEEPRIVYEPSGWHGTERTAHPVLRVNGHLQLKAHLTDRREALTRIWEMARSRAGIACNTAQQAQDKYAAALREVDRCGAELLRFDSEARRKLQAS